METPAIAGEVRRTELLASEDVSEDGMTALAEDEVAIGTAKEEKVEGPGGNHGAGGREGCGWAEEVATAGGNLVAAAGPAVEGANERAEEERRTATGGRGQGGAGDGAPGATDGGDGKAVAEGGEAVEDGKKKRVEKVSPFSGRGGRRAAPPLISIAARPIPHRRQFREA